MEGMGGIAGHLEIAQTLQRIQVDTMGDPEKMEALFLTRAIDPAALREAADVMLATATAMSQSPEDAVIGSFMTGALIGAMLGRETLTVGDMQSD